MRRLAKPDKYSHIDFKPPESVAKAAERGLEYRKKQGEDKAGLTPEEASKEGIGSGVQRAVNLKNRDEVSPETINKMVGFFARHEKNSKIDAKHKGEPWKDKGYVSWLLWGGDPGKTWAEKVKRQMETADEKAKKKAARRVVARLALKQAKAVGFHGWKMSPDSMRMPGPQFTHEKPIPREDVEKAVDYLKEVRPGVLVGYSRGGAVTMLALRSSSGAKPKVIYVAPAWRRGWAQTSPPSTSGVILHGDKDNAVPLAHSCELASRTGLPLRVVPDRNHITILKDKTNPGAGKLVPTTKVQECMSKLPDWGTSGKGSPEDIQKQVGFQEKLASENEPTNPKLWEKVQKLTKGEIKSLTHDGKTIEGPNDGAGFDVFPSAYANGWASKVYDDLGGGWKKKDSKKASRNVFAGKLQLGPARVDQTMSEKIRKMKLKARYTPGSLNGALLSAAYYAKKQGKTMFVFEGNSYMHRVFRVSFSPSDYLNPIDNTGDKVISVSPDLTVSWYDVKRRTSRTAKGRGKSKKDVGHGGLDEWFSGHGKGKGKGKGEDATWGDWVAISPVKKKLEDKTVNPGDIVGPCAQSDNKDWKELTNDGKDPLKCMPRQKAYDMPKKERAEKAKEKMRAERKDKDTGKKPTRTPTFKDKKKAVQEAMRSLRK